ncbi:cache domain-containing protein [Candidatus Parcubacteria bacterium]|nr:cache domain-containing protein [Candidatus Parcubacteria bacterium]
MKTFIVTFVVLVVLALGASAYFYLNKGDTAAAPNAHEVALAPEVEKVLVGKTELLKSVVVDPVIVAEVMASNEKNKQLSSADITELDNEWQASKEITPFIRQFLENKTALALLAFKRVHPEFKEIFVADAYGLNVGQTDKTSDYYQADEAWWQNSFAGGAGKVLHGKIEFDQSAQSEAISLYVPIMNTAGKAIGVMKGVVDLAAIKKEL